MSGSSARDEAELARIVAAKGPPRPAPAPLAALAMQGLHLAGQSAEESSALEEQLQISAEAKVRDSLKRAGVPERFHGRKLAELEPRGDFDTLEAKRYRAAVSSLAALKQRPGMLALLGVRGAGKSQLAAAAVRDHIEAGKSGRYTQLAWFFVDLLDAQEAREGARRRVVALYASPAILVIDEAHNRAGTDFERRMLDLLIDIRYSENRSTIFLSNDEPAKFQEALGLSICSRMNETGGIRLCTWRSFRDEEGAL